MPTLATLRAQGFDRSEHVPFTKQYRIKCSQCDALAVNGIACHETGCPNETFECKGCDTTLSYRGYCEDCQ